jgi:hypothetical protein
VPALVVIVLFAIACNGDSITNSYPFPEGRVLWTHPPLALSGAESFIAMGEPNVLPKDHGGFRLSNPYSFPASTPVFAVRDGVILKVRHGIRAVPEIPDAPQELWGREYNDWALQLKVSETITVNYAHVTELHQDILDQIGDIPTDEHDRNVFVVVEGGDTLGFVDPHAAMDFSATDRELQLSFLNPSRYPEGHIYSADILDYYQEPLLGQLLDITVRQLPPRGGKVDYDVAGRISGNWFREGTTSFVQWSRQLAIVYDHLEGDRIFISDGSPMRDVPGSEGPGRPDIWWVKGNAPRPETIGAADGIVEYELIFPGSADTAPALGVMLVEMFEVGKIRVEVFEGLTADQVSGFTAAAKVYER